MALAALIPSENNEGPIYRNPQRYIEGTERASLKRELDLLQDLLLQENWSMFNPRWMRLVNSYKDADLSHYVYPRIVELWIEMIHHNNQKDSLAKDRVVHELGWLIYYSAQLKSPKTISQEVETPIKELLNNYEKH